MTMLKFGYYCGIGAIVSGIFILGYDCICTDPGPKTWIGDVYYYLHAPKHLAFLGFSLLFTGVMCGLACSIFEGEQEDQKT